MAPLTRRGPCPPGHVVARVRRGAGHDAGLSLALGGSLRTIGRSPEDDRLSRIALPLALRGGVGLLGGTALAATTGGLDRWVGLELPLATATVRPLTATLVGALLTIAVFTLWMRTVVVGLASSQLSPRVLAGYLDDGFQQRVTAWMIAAISYVAVTAALLPSEGTGVPAISTVTTLVLVFGALAALLVAMRQAINSLSPPDVIRRIADTAFTLMERRIQPDDDAPDRLPETRDWQRIRSDTLGWVQEIDHDAILATLPPEGTILLRITVGDFIAVGETLGSVDAELGEDERRDLREAVSIARTRDARDDLAFAIQQLVDVAQHAVTPGSLDTSTAYEAIVHLRALLHRLLRLGTATGCRAGEDGRRVLSMADWQPSDHLVASFERLRRGAAQDPTSARHLLRTMELLRETAVEVGDLRAQEVLDEQRERLLNAMDEHSVPADHG